LFDDRLIFGAGLLFAPREEQLTGVVEAAFECGQACPAPRYATYHSSTSAHTPSGSTHLDVDEVLQVTNETGVGLGQRRSTIPRVALHPAERGELVLVEPVCRGVHGMVPVRHVGHQRIVRPETRQR
jgi:hypothetical protein